MSRVLKITFVLSTICFGAITFHLIRPESVVAQSTHASYVYKPKKGISASPTDARMLAGHYYRGDGTGYNIELNLKSNGTYSAEWHGCLGTYGKAAGVWNLAGTQVVFVASKETDMMRGHLKRLEVLKFQGHWILLPTKRDDREFYDKWGVSAYSCFQNTNSIFRGP
jgi:hypothetical protein